MENFDLNIQNSIISVVDHHDAKIKTTEALQHVISKCAENIDLFLKISFGGSVSARSLLTPQVNYVCYYGIVFESHPMLFHSMLFHSIET